MTELEGFELFKPGKDETLFITTNFSKIMMCKEVFQVLGKPEYVNVFLDEVKQRIMIKAAEKDYENAIRVIEYKSKKSKHFCSKKLATIISNWYGKSQRVYGHVAGNNLIIFDRRER